MHGFRKFSQRGGGGGGGGGGGWGGKGGVQLQTRVGPTKFYHFKAHKLENRGGVWIPCPPPLDLHMELMKIIFPVFPSMSGLMFYFQIFEIHNQSDLL